MKDSVITHQNKYSNLRAYLMLYASQCVPINTSKKREYLSSFLSENDLQSILNRFRQDSDFECLSRILEWSKQIQLSVMELNAMLDHLLALCASCERSSSVDQFRIKQLSHLLTNKA